MKAIVVYDSQYGNTRLVAEEIIEGMKEEPGTEAVLSNVKETDPGRIAGFELVLVGSPVHMGRATKRIKQFIEAVGKLEPGVKKTAAFDTYMSKDYAKAVKNIEQLISEKATGFKLLTEGLSIRVRRMKGPIAEGELPKAREFGRRITLLAKNGGIV